MGLNPEAAPSSLKFGTSGLRGLVVELNGTPAFAYTRAFAEMLKEDGSVAAAKNFVLVGRDLRASSPSIAQLRLCGPAGIRAQPARLRRSSHAGARLPWHALRDPGDHGDREPYSRGPQWAEILSGSRRDRQTGRGRHPGMACQAGDHSRTGDSPWHPPEKTGSRSDRRLQDSLPRFLRCKGAGGLTVGVYQHSSVARDIIVDMLETLGARTVPLGRATSFIPVDTEALREEDEILARQWAG